MSEFLDATRYDHGLQWDHPLQVQVMRSVPSRARRGRPDMHYELHFGVVLSGCMLVSYPGLSFEVGPGQVWFTGCWEPHFGLPTEETTLVLFTVLLESLGHIAPFADVAWEGPFLCPCGERPQARDERLCDLTLSRAREVAALSESAGGDGELVLWLRFHEVLLPFTRMVAAGVSGGVGEISRIRPALDLMRSTQDVVTVGEAAECCGLGRRRFSQLFRQSFGVSFGRFALRARLSGAAGDLRSTDASLKQVASKWGFYDASHFHRSFVAHFGVRPSDLRHSRESQDCMNMEME